MQGRDKIGETRTAHYAPPVLHAGTLEISNARTYQIQTEGIRYQYEPKWLN